MVIQDNNIGNSKELLLIGMAINELNKSKENVKNI